MPSPWQSSLAPDMMSHSSGMQLPLQSLLVPSAMSTMSAMPFSLQSCPGASRSRSTGTKPAATRISSIVPRRNWLWSPALFWCAPTRRGPPFVWSGLTKATVSNAPSTPKRSSFASASYARLTWCQSVSPISSVLACVAATAPSP